MRDKVSRERLTQIYTVFVIVFLVIGFASIVAVNKYGFQIVTNFWSTNDLASQTSTIFAPASKVLLTFEFRWSLLLIAAMSLIVPILYLYKINKKDDEIDFKKYGKIDWIIFLSVMTVLIAILSGVQDISALIAIGFITLVGYYLLDQSFSFKKQKYLRVLGIVGTYIPWFIIVTYAIGTLLYGSVRTPWYVYASYVIGLIAASFLLLWTQYEKTSIKKIDQTQKIAYPLISSQLIKVIYLITLIIGFKK